MSCLHLFRHLAQFVLARRQPCVVLIVQSDEKSDCAIHAQSLCGIAIIKQEGISHKMTLTGKLFRDAVISGANNIANNRAAVDELNVFPVPDGDTGTNMSMTIGNALPELKAAGDGISAGDAAKLTASAMLRGARGNSGVILSLIFRGLSKGLAGQAEADAKMLSDAFKLGVDAAYKSVMKPTEGTILTVVREAWENTKDSAQEGGDAAEFLAKFIEEGEKSLANTPELLPALKKAGVVDAGGKGLLVILSGMQRVISGGGMIRSEEETTPSAPAAVAAAGSISFVAQNNKIGSGMVLAGVESMVTGQLVGGISKKLRIKEPDKEILTIKKIEHNEKNRIRNKISKRKAVDRYRKKAKLKKKPLKTRIKRFFSARKRLKSVKKGLKRARRVVYSTLVKNSIVSGIYNAAKRTVGRYNTSIKKRVHYWAGSIRRKFRRWWK